MQNLRLNSRGKSDERHDRRRSVNQNITSKDNQGQTSKQPVEWTRSNLRARTIPSGNEQGVDDFTIAISQESQGST